MRRRCVYCAKSVPPSCSCDCARTYANTYALCVTRYVIINVNRITAESFVTCSIHRPDDRYIQTYTSLQSPEISLDGLIARTHVHARVSASCVYVRARRKFTLHVGLLHAPKVLCCLLLSLLIRQHRRVINDIAGIRVTSQGSRTVIVRDETSEILSRDSQQIYILYVFPAESFHPFIINRVFERARDAIFGAIDRYRACNIEVFFFFFFLISEVTAM